jgi:hypothetical protein
MDSTSRGSQMCRLGRINLKWLTNVMTQVRGRKFVDMQNGVQSCMLSQSFHFLNINRMHNAWNENCIVTSPAYIVFITDSCFSHITQILGCPSFLRQIIWFYFWLQQQNSSHCWKPCFIIKNFAWFFFLCFCQFSHLQEMWRWDFKIQTIPNTLLCCLLSVWTEKHTQLQTLWLTYSPCSSVDIISLY